MTDTTTPTEAPIPFSAELIKQLPQLQKALSSLIDEDIPELPHNDDGFNQYIERLNATAAADQSCKISAFTPPKFYTLVDNQSHDYPIDIIMIMCLFDDAQHRLSCSLQINPDTLIISIPTSLHQHCSDPVLAAVSHDQVEISGAILSMCSEDPNYANFLMEFFTLGNIALRSAPKEQKQKLAEIEKTFSELKQLASLTPVVSPQSAQ